MILNVLDLGYTVLYLHTFWFPHAFRWPGFGLFEVLQFCEDLGMEFIASVWWVRHPFTCEMFEVTCLPIHVAFKKGRFESITIQGSFRGSDRSIYPGRHRDGKKSGFWYLHRSGLNSLYFVLSSTSLWDLFQTLKAPCVPLSVILSRSRFDMSRLETRILQVNRRTWHESWFLSSFTNEACFLTIEDLLWTTFQTLCGSQVHVPMEPHGTSADESLPSTQIHCHHCPP